MPDLVTALDDEVGDDLLRLMFIACHPVLSDRGAGRTHPALTGRVVDREIARAFLVPEPPSRSALSAPSVPCGSTGSVRSASRRASSPTACRRSWRSSTSSLMRATPRPLATTG